MQRFPWIAILAGFGVGLLCSFSLADEPQKPSLNDQLLEDLADPSGPPSKDKTATDPKSEIDRELMQDLDQGEDLGAEKEKPLEELAQRMKQSQQRMRTRDTSAETQSLQKDISDRLARLIEQAEKQGQPGGGKEPKSGSGKAGDPGDTEGGSPKPGSAAESTKRVDRTESIEQGSANVQDTIRRVWGHLPEKMREQMLNSLDDEFLPKYEKLIEQYYQRLAEQPAGGT